MVSENTMHAFIHSSDKYLLSTNYAPTTLLYSKDTAANKTKQNKKTTALLELITLQEIIFWIVKNNKVEK